MIIYRFLIFVSLYLPYCLCQYSVFNFIQNQKHIYNDDFKGLFQQLPNPCVDLGGGWLSTPPPPTNFKHIKNHTVKFSKMNLDVPLIKKDKSLTSLPGHFFW